MQPLGKRGQDRLPREQASRRELAVQHFEALARNLSKLGVRADVRELPKLSWREMCRARYMLHVDGIGSSMALKCELSHTFVSGYQLAISSRLKFV